MPNTQKRAYSAKNDEVEEVEMVNKNGNHVATSSKVKKLDDKVIAHNK